MKDLIKGRNWIKTIQNDGNIISIYIMLFMIIHGEMLFNKLSWHDDIFAVRGFTGALEHGRFTYSDIVNITLHLLLVHPVTCFIMQPLPMNHSISFS